MQNKEQKTNAKNSKPPCHSTAVINLILIWKSMLKQEMGSKVGLSVLCTQAKKVGLPMVPYPREHSVMTLKENISNSLCSYQKLISVCTFSTSHQIILSNTSTFSLLYPFA